VFPLRPRHQNSFPPRRGRDPPAGRQHLQNCSSPWFTFFGLDADISAIGQALGRLVLVDFSGYPPSISSLFPGSLPGALPGYPGERSYLGASFALRCFQRLSLPDIATRLLPRARQPIHQRSVHSGPLVLGAAPLKPLPPTMDRDRTVSRRSEPSSRTALIGEQPNPWDLIQPQDATSRHRGAKPCRRCERLGKISLLSPG